MSKPKYQTYTDKILSKMTWMEFDRLVRGDFESKETLSHKIWEVYKQWIDFHPVREYLDSAIRKEEKNREE